MATRSRKQLASLNNDPPPAFEPRAKRLRSWKSKRSPLMELPAEIRIKILTELLWQHEPLRVTRDACRVWNPEESSFTSARRISNFSFCPEVLLVCRSIHEEGVAILYNNTIGCDVWCENDGLDYVDYQTSFLRHVWDVTGRYISNRLNSGELESFDQRSDSVKALLSRVKKLDVVVRVHIDDACKDTRTAVREFVQAARRLPLLSEMDIHLWIGVDRWSETLHNTRRYEIEIISEQDYRDFALGPFALFRSLRRVTFTGLSTRIAEELGRVMTGQQPVVDLPRMYNNLVKYIEARIHYDHCRMCFQAFRHVNRAEIEADMEDEHTFRRSRSKILDIIADHERADVVKLLLNDTEPPPTSNIHDSVSNIEGDGNESITPEDEYQKALREMEESQVDRDSKRDQEQDRPSLKRLREVLCKERALV